MASIQQVMADPQFKTFSPEAQQRILSSLQGESLVGVPMSQDERVASTLALSKIKEPEAGILLPETPSQSLTGAISRGGLSGATFGLSEAIPKRLGIIPSQDKLGPEAQHPVISLGSSILGGIPTGLGIGKVAGAGLKLAGFGKGSVTASKLSGAATSTLSNAIKNALTKSGPTGAGYSAISGSVQKLGEPGSTPEEIAQAGVENAPLGYALGVSVPALVGAFKVGGKVLGGMKGRTPQQLFSGATNTNIEGADDHLPEVLYYSGKRNSLLTPTEQLINGAEAAVDARTDFTRKFVDQAAPSIKVKYFANYPTQSKSYIQSELNKLHTLSDQQRRLIADKIDSTIDNATPETILDLNRQLNAETSALHDVSSAYDQMTKYELNLKAKLAKYNSDLIKSMMKDQGANPEIYSGSGRIGAMVGSLKRALKQADDIDKIAGGASTGEAMAEKAATKGISPAIATGILKTSRKVTGGEVGKMNSKILRIFEKVEPVANPLRANLPYFPPPGVAAGPRPAPVVVPPTPSTLPGQFNAPTASVQSTIPPNLNALINQSIQTNPSSSIVNEDIKAALKQLGIKPSDPEYRRIGLLMQKQGEIINP